MTQAMMDLRALVEKSADADLLREMIGFVAERLVELEVGAKTNAEYDEKSAERMAQRNDYRDRDWQTRAGQVELKITRLRTGSYFPSFLEPRRSVENAEEDVLAYMTFPAQHRRKLHSTNPIERLNGEIKRRTDVVGIFPNEASIRRLVGAILMEQTEEWTVQRGRYMTLDPKGSAAKFSAHLR